MLQNLLSAAAIGALRVKFTHPYLSTQNKNLWVGYSMNNAKMRQFQCILPRKFFSQNKLSQLFCALIVVGIDINESFFLQYSVSLKRRYKYRY